MIKTLVREVGSLDARSFVHSRRMGVEGGASLCATLAKHLELLSSGKAFDLEQCNF